METYDIEIPKPPYLGDTNWKLTQLTPITIIFGKNGSGKSILLRNLRDKDPDQYSYIVPERAGDLQYKPQFVDNEISGQKRAASAKSNLNPTYRDQVIARVSAFLQKRGTKDIPKPGSIIEIESSLQELFPNFKFTITPDSPHFNIQRLPDFQDANNASVLSSGEIQLITLGLDLLLACEIWELDDVTGTLLIDEPDTHVHPDLQQRLAQFLVRLYHRYNCKIIAATHSTTLLAALGHYGQNKTSLIYLDYKKEHKAKPFDKFLQTLSTCLGGHALMGPLFNFPILLVEGDDDYRIWSEIPRHHKIQFAVIPCGGDEIHEYQKSLENLFSSMLDSSNSTSGYALLDGDQTKPNSKQDHVKYLVLNCHESENLYLTDELLKELGYNTWDEACNKIIERSDEFGDKSAKLKDVKNWDRKTVDCKDVINEIQKILDEKNLPWSYRLGKVLGAKKPEGQLASFLGEETVSSLWK